MIITHTAGKTYDHMLLRMGNAYDLIVSLFPRELNAFNTSNRHTIFFFFLGIVFIFFLVQLRFACIKRGRKNFFFVLHSLLEVKII